MNGVKGLWASVQGDPAFMRRPISYEGMAEERRVRVGTVFVGIGCRSLVDLAGAVLELLALSLLGDLHSGGLEPTP
jgi:hypothetical protein